MGTRADFYVGKGKDAEWLGSIAWDGYPSGIDQKILKAKTKKAFIERVNEFLAERDDGTKPEQGWPWPWDNSRTTDYSYAFEKRKVWASCFGYGWFDPLESEPEREDGAQKEAIFPDMSDKKNVTFGKRSGMMIFKG